MKSEILASLLRISFADFLWPVIAIISVALTPAFSGALRHVPIVLHQTEEITEMYH